ncbi:MAG: PA2779 family protein [Gammaproteobacteria bacterium]|nr:PA2779 family protein [Gammaproteobacteria bacterium]
MFRLFSKQLFVVAMTLCLVTLPLIQTAAAAIISTETAIELTDRVAQVDRINAVLARESVQDALIRMGVDPVNAMARVDVLTNQELQTLEQQLDKLPAGGVGVVEVVGIVAIVLVILELLHVTNFFSEF